MTAPGSAASRAPVRVPAGDRGATTVADRVVAKIAARAAWEALCTAPERRLTPAAHRPTASAVVRSGAAWIKLSVELGYPMDLRTVCQGLRGSIARRVSALTGMAVSEIVVHIERLHPWHQAEEQVERVR